MSGLLVGNWGSTEPLDQPSTPHFHPAQYKRLGSEFHHPKDFAR
ncbi:hypothetical protein SynA1560_02037 [Synechococcus sp. A15-60]|nr:hypothetical protein SynA1560_02037 [Synechococcus sp. A15-60]